MSVHRGPDLAKGRSLRLDKRHHKRTESKIMAEYPQLLHTVLDTTTPRQLAEFYRQLLGLRYRSGDEPPADGSPDEADWLVLVDSDGARKLGIGEARMHLV